MRTEKAVAAVVADKLVDEIGSFGVWRKLVHGADSLRTQMEAVEVGVEVEANTMVLMGYMGVEGCCQWLPVSLNL